MILIYTTLPSKKTAKDIAKILLEKHLIACANMIEMNSIYRWENKIHDEPEFLLIIKTSEDKYEDVKSEIESIHPYDIPCILKIPVESNKEFCDWVASEVKDMK